MIGEPLKPATLRPTEYGIDPALVTKRAATHIPDLVSVKIRELFPDMPEPIYPSDKGIAAIREATEKNLEHVDMSMIRPHHSVNILASSHGFTILGGEPYAELLRTIKTVVQKKTGSRNIRLRAGVGLRFRETEEYIERFKLDDFFGRASTRGVAPIDEGISIETEIGTYYGLKRVYDADWIIHAHNSDIREIHFHRLVDRAVKPFGMSYARIETRSSYHLSLGPRAANFVARAIFDSPFVQSKWTFACFLLASPVGVLGVDADNDLYALNDRLTYATMKTYGKLMTLLGEIKDSIVIVDSPGPLPYTFAGGVIFCNFVSANIDLFDLDIPLPPYTFYTEAYYDESRRPMIEGVPPVNPEMKMMIINHCWGGYPFEFFAAHIPTVVVGNAMADLLGNDSQNRGFMDHAVVANDLETALDFARKVTKAKNILVFDGAAGGLNVNKPLAEYLLDRAPEVSQRVDEELMPRWLRQRGMEGWQSTHFGPRKEKT